MRERGKRGMSERSEGCVLYARLLAHKITQYYHRTFKTDNKELLLPSIKQIL